MSSPRGERSPLLRMDFVKKFSGICRLPQRGTSTTTDSQLKAVGSGAAVVDSLASLGHVGALLSKHSLGALLGGVPAWRASVGIWIPALDSHSPGDQVISDSPTPTC